jgi:hypothetical protein
MMKRTLVSCSALAAGALLMVGPAHAGAPPVNGTGAVGACATTGQIKIKPALVTGGTSPTVLSVQTKPPKGVVGPCPGATVDGATVISGKAKGSGTGTTNDCTSLLGSSPSNLVLIEKWKVTKGSPKLAPSTITITSQTGGVSSSPAGHGEFIVSGTVTAGSFVGDTVTADLVTDQDVTELLTACGAKGIKKITIGVKASKDDHQIGSGTTTITP